MISNQQVKKIFVKQRGLWFQIGINLTKQFFLKYRNSSLIQFKLGLYVFKTYFLVLSLCNTKKQKSYFCLPTIYIRLSWLHIHNQQDNNMFGKKKIPAMFVFVKRYMKRTASKKVFVGVLSLILSRTSPPFSCKVWKYHQNLTPFHP